MDSLDEVKEAMSGKRVSKKKDEAPVVTPTVVEEDAPVVDKTVDEVVDNREQSGFLGCNTCRNFGSYPSWVPCRNCRHNPNNQQSFYQR
jgi:hypothetical protein